MPRDITVTFDDGTTHVYRGAPDDVTPDAVQARAQKDFGKAVKALDGGRAPAIAAQPFAIPGPPPSLVAPSAVPAEVPIGRRAIQFVRPTVEAVGGALGGVAGAAAGTFGAGPVGTAAGGVLGAGLGYGAAKTGLDVLEQALGYQAPPKSATEAISRGVEDVLTGTTYEAGGRALGSAIGTAAGKLADIRQLAKQKAARIAQQSLGRDLDNVVNTLRAAPPNASVAQITASIENPTWQALINKSLERDPQFLRKLNLLGERESRNALAQLAGGETAAEVRAGAEAAKARMSALTQPAREAALERANLGRDVVGYEAQAARLRGQAAGEVQDVRKLVGLQAQAEAAAAQTPMRAPSGERIGMPLAPGRYTYAGDLAKKADEWATQAANASLDLGQGARFAQGAADAMRSVGIKPLQAEPLVRSLSAVERNPEFAGNDVMRAAVNNLSRDIAEWTGKGGVIDAFALDAIRKNSVNAAVRDLLKGQDPSIQREAAASVMTRIKPLLVDAIESAGGVGYRDYLADYSKRAQDIAARKLTGEAARLWKTDKDAFVRLVQNESPDTVEKFLGSGKYNIATELADSAMDTLRQQAQKRLTDLSVKSQITEGQAALAELLRQNISKFRLPSHLSAWITNTNRSLQWLENAVGNKTMAILTDAMKSPEAAARLLETLPGPERVRVSALMQGPVGTAMKAAAKMAPPAALPVANALAPESESQNALAP